ncbi:Short-chain-enoyl-CoA hydratase [Alphaproteobacteria bacterium SO-S41]|nr:Short-chain-enoyl-CoA hydratase [Alphaproteobacteria bacterium SO-S41]
MPGSIEVEIAPDGVATLTICRPEQQNRLDLEDLDALSAALDIVMGDEAVRAIVLTGKGKHFSAGASTRTLEALRTAKPLEIHGSVYARAQGVARRLYRMPKPVVAAISGAAITLGCEFALACDFRLVDETAFFQEAWIKLGLLPPLGGLYLLPKMIGVTRASEMVLRGREVRAEEAIAIGLANRIVAGEALLQEAQTLAAELGALSPTAYGFAKTALHRGLESTIEAEWSANAMAQAMLISSNDFSDAMQALQERRKPTFTGR